MARLAGEWPTSGSRRITALVRREGLPVNHTRGARLMRPMGVQGQRPARRPRTTPSTHGYPRDRNLGHGLTIERPDQVGVGDITSVRVREECVYLAVLREVSTRRLRGGHLSRPLDQTLTLTALRRAWAPPTPEMPHAEQGAPYAATASIHTRQALGVPISMAAGGEATEHGEAERLRRTLKEAEVTLHD